MIPTSSRKIGPARAPSGYRLVVFEAVLLLVCEACDRSIQPGERFSRRTIHGRGQGAFVHCRECRPFSGDPPADQVVTVDHDKWLTLDQAAIRSGLTIGEVDTLVRHGEVFTMPIAGCRRIDAEQFDRALAEAGRQ